MNRLLSIIPGPSLLYRIAAYAAVALALIGFGWLKGSEHWHTKLIEAQTAALKEGVRIQTVRGEVTTKVETKYVKVLVHDGVVTETITKEVPVYVPASTPDLPGGFRLLADAAAAGVVPDPARLADAAPVPAQVATASVVANYGSCRQVIHQLEGLQEWVREQQKVH
jgi:hypothetical protein